MKRSLPFVRLKSSNLVKYLDAQARITGVRTKMKRSLPLVPLVRPKSSNLAKYLDTHSRITDVRTKIKDVCLSCDQNRQISPNILIHKLV